MLSQANTLILRSAHLRASRRMAASPPLPASFETLASQAPQDEVGIPWHALRNAHLPHPRAVTSSARRPRQRRLAGGRGGQDWPPPYFTATGGRACCGPPRPIFLASRPGALTRPPVVVLQG